MLTSCSTINQQSYETLRKPANNALPPDDHCIEIIKSLLMSKDYKENLNKALIDRKLISYSDRKIVLNRPHQKWMNKLKHSLITTVRNWNNHRYPSFYTFDEEDVVPTAILYAEYLEKLLTNQIPDNAGPIMDAFNDVNQWIKIFENYKLDIDQLLEERISLQYNLNLLKKVKLKDDEVREILFTTKINGEFQNKIITFRNEDDNLDFVIKQLQREISEIDESINSSGRLKERIIRQALLKEMLTVVHRELERVIENTPIPNRDVVSTFNTLSLHLKNRDYAPSSFGVYKIQDKIFMNELRELPKVPKFIQKIPNPLKKIKAIADHFFADKSAGSEEEKIGLFKKLYLKITNITAKQAAIASGSVALVGLGFERFFSLNNGAGKTKEMNTEATSQSIPKEEITDPAHQEQLLRSKEAENKKQEGIKHQLELLIQKIMK